MNRLNHSARRTFSAIFTALILILAPLAAAATRAQTAPPPSLTPILDCISTDSSGLTTAVFGYTSTYESQQFILVGSRNYFSPNSPNQGQPNYFETGEHHAVFSVGFYLENISQLTWNLDGKSVTAAAGSPPCRTAGTITYQGRLSASGTQTSGNYDLQFRLFNSPVGGTSFGTLITAVNTPVVNGIFTVPLEFSENALAAPARLYLEISVKPAGATGSYTTLQPRQQLTDAPSAVFATRAARADNADLFGGRSSDYFVLTYDARLTDARQPAAGSGNYIQNTTAPQANSNFNISGGGIVGGSLTANTLAANSNSNVVVTAQSASGIGTWLGLRNTSTGGGIWNLISTGGANAEGAGNLLFNNGATQMILSASALTVNSKISVAGGVLARGGAPGGNNANNNGYAFSDSGDSDSGLFSSGNGEVSLYTNSAERLRVTDAGASVTGNLTVSGAINGTATNAANATNATNVSGGFVQLPLTNGAPPASECGAANQYGRQKVDAANVWLYICTAAGWKFTTLQ